MADVPVIDYEEPARKELERVALTLVPPVIRKAWADKELRHFINSGSVTINRFVSAFVPLPEGWTDSRALQEKILAATDVSELLAKHEAQRSQRGALESKVRGVAYGMTTRKALAEALPEFEKYLPPDEAAAIRTLPVVANVVADFVKAGWPKDKKVVKARAAA
jgi:hypothetical protein